MKEKILTDLTNAMKAQDKELLSVLRMVKGAIQLEEIKLKKELTEEEVMIIINREVKTRKESIAEFAKGNRTDLMEKTEQEINLLKKYLPEQLTEEEIDKIIEQVFSSVHPTGPSDIGKIMGKLVPLVRGKADMNVINQKIKERLN